MFYAIFLNKEARSVTSIIKSSLSVHEFEQMFFNAFQKVQFKLEFSIFHP